MRVYDKKEKNEIVQRVVKKIESVKEIGKRLNIPESTIHTWVARFENKALLEKHQKNNSAYDREFKLNAVNMAKVEKKSIKEVSKKTGASPASISNWIAALWKPDIKPVETVKATQQETKATKQETKATQQETNESLWTYNRDRFFNEETKPSQQENPKMLLQEILYLQKERDYYKQQMEYFMRMAFRSI